MADTPDQVPSTAVTGEELEQLTPERAAEIESVWAQNKLGPPQTRDPKFWLTNPSSD